jgi:hypothetical protein
MRRSIHWKEAIRVLVGLATMKLNKKKKIIIKLKKEEDEEKDKKGKSNWLLVE